MIRKMILLLPLLFQAPGDRRDFPSAPLSVVAASGSDYELQNRSEVDIVAFRLACIAHQQSLVITFLFPAVKSTIQPGEKSLVFGKDGPPIEVAQCMQLKSKLVVYEADTADGGSWYIKGAKFSPACKPQSECR
jgi:hypothetical protein